MFVSEAVLGDLRGFEKVIGALGGLQSSCELYVKNGAETSEAQQTLDDLFRVVSKTLVDLVCIGIEVLRQLRVLGGQDLGGSVPLGVQRRALLLMDAFEMFRELEGDLCVLQTCLFVKQSGNSHCPIVVLCCLVSFRPSFQMPLCLPSLSIQRPSPSQHQIQAVSGVRWVHDGGGNGDIGFNERSQREVIGVEKSCGHDPKLSKDCDCECGNVELF